MKSFEPAYSFGREKFYQAVDSLVTGTGSIQDRLESAAMVLTPLNPNEFLPKEMHDEFGEIHHLLTKTPAQGDEGKIRATLQLTSDEEASKLAGLIFSAYVNLRGGI
jgi:hypothetical protein